MDRDVLKEHLAQAKRHIAKGERTLAHQRELVQELERHGHDTSRARALLNSFEQLQALHFSDRDRLRAQLAAAE